MERAGFVLAGGGSTRMGRDKALLPDGNRSLLESTASKVAEVTGSAVIIGPPERYRDLVPFRIYPDRLPGCGPIGGLETALALELGEWNLVVACDMPQLETGVLAALFDRIPDAHEPLSCIVPVTQDGPQPLCALYHASCLAAVRKAISNGCFKLRTMLLSLHTVPVKGLPAAAFANANTPGDWAALFPASAGRSYRHER